MEVNKRILKLGLIGTFIALTISLIFALYIKLDNPVVLKSYIEERVNTNEEDFEAMQLQMIYITNVYDQKEINYIEMTDKQGTAKLLGSNLEERSENYGLYNVNTVYLQMNKHDRTADLDGLEFNRAMISFNTGDTMDIDLGRLILYEEDFDENGLEQSSSSSSSDGSSSNIFTTQEKVTLTKLDSPLFKNIENLYSINIDDKDYKDIAGTVYEKERVIRIKSQFETDKNILNRYTMFTLNPKLYFQDEAGNQGYTSIHNISQIPYEFNFTGILKYLKVRGEI